MRSMTGFGAATREVPGGSVSVELRSVNNRSLKVSLRLPAALAGREAELEALVREGVSRGTVQVGVRLLRATEPDRRLFDDALARSYAEGLAELARSLGVPGEPDLAMVVGMPGVVPQDLGTGEDSEALAEGAAAALREALAALRASRDQEGRALLADFLRRADRVGKATSKVGRRAPRTVEDVRRRLSRRLKEVLRDQPVAVAREAVAREVALLAERSDISEEVTRLGAHLRAFRAAAKGPGETGRRLDFLLQEMLREVNTIGSKSQDAAIAAAVVDMKVEVDRMKEQAANVE